MVDEDFQMILLIDVEMLFFIVVRRGKKERLLGWMTGRQRKMLLSMLHE